MLNYARVSATITDAFVQSDLPRLHRIRLDLIGERSQLDRLVRHCEDNIEILESKTNPTKKELLELLADERKEIIDWSKFFRQNDANFVCSTLLSSLRSCSGSVTLLGRALFLLCALEEETIALRCFIHLRRRCPESKFMKVVHCAGECARVEHDSRGWGCAWLVGYERVFVLYVQHFDGIGLAYARRFWPSDDVLLGFIAAQMYRKDYSLTTCLEDNEEGMEFLLDIVCLSPYPLSSDKASSLALYALRHYNLREEYKELVEDNFHCYLIVNSRRTDILPENYDLKNYLEQMGYCEDNV